MNAAAKKIKLIFLPFLLIAVVFTLVYSYLNYSIFIKTNTVPPSDMLIYIWGPLFLPFIPILIWLKPRLKLLKFSEQNKNFINVYIGLAFMAIGFPTIVAQYYLKQRYAVLLSVENVNQIDQTKPANYYALKKFYIDNTNIGVYTSTDFSGKLKNRFNMNIYAVLPIFASHTDTANPKCLAWLGVHYSKSINNLAISENLAIDDKEREDAFQAFLDSSNNTFNKTDFNQFVYLENITNDHKGSDFEEAIKKNIKYSSDNMLIFESQNKAFVNDTGNMFVWIFIIFGIMAGLLFASLLIPKLDEQELKRYEK